MIIQTNFIPSKFDAFTCWPFIFIRPRCFKDIGLIEHENVHYYEQGALSLFWLAKYFLSNKFRLEAEVRAYKVQIEIGGITIDKAARNLMNYKLGITYEEAFNKLNN